MVDFTYKEINPQELFLSLRNPRYVSIQDNQIDAIRQLLASEGSKIYKLAKSILRNRTNPSELPMVIPASSGKGYVVLEGNRRLAAIRLIEDPSLASDNPADKWRVNFFRLSQGTSSRDPITKMLCVVFDNEETAAPWVAIRHTGQNGGAGLVRWDSEATQRFKSRFSHKSYELQVLDFIREYGKLGEGNSKGTGKRFLSSLKRLVGDPAVRKKFGISKDGISLRLDLPPQEVIKPLLRTYTDLSTERIKVKDIYTKEDRQAYIDSFHKNDLPSSAARRTKKGAADESEKTTPSSSKKKRENPSSLRRLTLIPSDCRIKIKKTRINDIYKELKSLMVEDFPNAAAILFRVF